MRGTLTIESQRKAGIEGTLLVSLACCSVAGSRTRSHSEQELESESPGWFSGTGKWGLWHPQALTFSSASWPRNLVSHEIPLRWAQSQTL